MVLHDPVDTVNLDLGCHRIPQYVFGACRKCGLRQSTPVYARFTPSVGFRGCISAFIAVRYISGSGSGYMSALGVTGVRGGDRRRSGGLRITPDLPGFPEVCDFPGAYMSGFTHVGGWRAGK